MKEKMMVSCGGVVIFRGKVLLLYYRTGKNTGWVLPKGKAEHQESRKEAALREVKEETGATAKIVKPLGNTHYSFQRNDLTFHKTVYWYLMTSDSYYCKPQAEENFADGGYYKQHEAFHLLKYPDEKELLCRAYKEYSRLRHIKYIPADSAKGEAFCVQYNERGQQ